MPKPQVIILIVSGLILILGVFNDIKSRKVNNKLVLAMAIAAALCRVLFDSPTGLLHGFMAALAAFVLSFSLVKIKIIGAGDVKLLMAFALLSDINNVFWIIIYSFVWGAVLGLIKYTVSGELKTLLKNTLGVAMRQKIEQKQLHQIPFTVALFLAFLTQLTLNKQLGGIEWPF